MNWENLIGQETITYGFDKFTQDDFCTTVILLLSAILIINFFILTNILFKGREIEKISDDITDIKNQNSN